MALLAKSWGATDAIWCPSGTPPPSTPHVCWVPGASFESLFNLRTIAMQFLTLVITAHSIVTSD